MFFFSKKKKKNPKPNQTKPNQVKTKQENKQTNKQTNKQQNKTKKKTLTGKDDPTITCSHLMAEVYLAGWKILNDGGNLLNLVD